MNASTHMTVRPAIRNVNELMAILAVRPRSLAPTQAVPVAINKHDDVVPAIGTRKAARLDQSGFVI